MADGCFGEAKLECRFDLRRGVKNRNGWGGGGEGEGGRETDSR